MQEPKRPATLQRAAEYAGVTVRTIQRWLAAGLITRYGYERGPRKVEVDLAEIDVLTRPSATRAS